MRNIWAVASRGTVLASMLALAACSGEPSEANPQTGATVNNSTGGGSNLLSFDVQKQGRRYQVQVFNRGEGARVITVTARSYRGVDRSDARNAYDAAFEAGQKIDCSGGPMVVFPDSATFQEEGRRSAFTSGESAWVFQGRCG